MISGRKRGGGYTIVETLIFLSITGFLFMVAVTTIGGKQANVQFTQATRDAQAKIATVINEVASGYVPTDSSQTCTANSAIITEPPQFSPSAQPTTQGTSSDCVFIGKVLHFNGSEVNVISMTGRRNTTIKGKNGSNDIKDTPASSIGETLPTAIPNVTTSFNLQYGLRVTKIMTVNDPAKEYGSIAFLTTLPKYNSSTLTLSSGTQRVSFGAVPETLPTDTLDDATAKASNITDVLNSSDGRRPITMNPTGGIIICLADEEDPANAKRFASLTLGLGAGQTTATLKAYVAGEVRTPCP